MQFIDSIYDFSEFTSRLLLWYPLRATGSVAYWLHLEGVYYWALRAMCNWARMDWYGRPLRGKVFERVGKPW